MGFEIGFCKTFDTPIDPYTYLCGWEMQTIARRITELGIKIDDYTYKIEVKDLAFLKDLNDKIQQNELFRILDALSDIDEILADNLMESFSPAVKASLALTFHLNLNEEDDKRWIKHEICRNLWLLQDYASTARILAKGYNEMVKDNVKEVYFYISF